MAERIPLLGRFLKRKKVRVSARVYRGIDSSRRQAGIIYYLFRALFRAISKTQHAEIQYIGLENIPPDGSVLLVGNHPNSMLDYFNLATVIRHPVATAAKDTITAIPLLGYLLKNHVFMIPISRKMDHSEDLPEEARRDLNEKSMKESVDHLVTGRLFNMYAEGKSTDSRKLNKIKLGFMYLAIQAERQFNFNLNLRIVPYGYFYDRINQFQSSVCIVFGKPFKLKHLLKIPDDFLSLSVEDRNDLEKKIMTEGKARLQKDIEELIISIPEKSIVDIIDDAASLYVLTPVKYMGQFGNVREKYRLSKSVADSFMEAQKTGSGRARLERLRQAMADYRRQLSASKIPDALIRREHTLASTGHHIKSLFLGILFYPLTFFGFITNFIPRQAGRFLRYLTIDVRKRPRVDGDEQAIVAAFVAAILTYPVIAFFIFLFFQRTGLPELAGWITVPWFRTFVAVHGSLLSATIGAFSMYLMARLWRFSLYYGQMLRDALYWMRDFFSEVFRRRKLKELRALRYEIMDMIDFIIGDFS